MKSLQAQQRAAEFFVGPKSVCRCGHTGDGLHSQHAPTIVEGHGACNVKGCNCARFTWAAHTEAFAKVIA